MIDLQILKKCHTILGPAIDITGKLPFYTDTRKYKHPGVFVAIPGSKVNPLDVINNLLDQGCPIVIFQENDENLRKAEVLSKNYPLSKFLPVTDSVLFLQELTALHTRSWLASDKKNTVFAISGSNGKTTHKEMLAFILNKIIPGKVVATEKNNNNHLGVPLTLLGINDHTEMIVLELGSNHPGEIKTLCDIASPNAGITTNIGATHLEFFGTEEKVFEEEGYLYHAVKANTHGEGFYLINLDDPYLNKLTSFKGAITLGEGVHAMAVIELHHDGASIRYNNQEIQVSNKQITGKHNKINLITCAFIAHHFYPALKEKIIAAAGEFRPTKNRSEWLVFEQRDVFLDAYNANPSSMKAALEGFKESVLQKGLGLSEACVVLGDMNELGEEAPRYHREIGQIIKELNFKNVYFIGRFAGNYQEGFPEGKGHHSVSDFKAQYRERIFQQHQIHFIKGSRSLQLESLFDIT
jgi:UDP-N-acetylmuramoyl-tripeptide--D-alanyl-D-alanine ligase